MAAFGASFVTTTLDHEVSRVHCTLGGFSFVFERIFDYGNGKTCIKIE